MKRIFAALAVSDLVLLCAAGVLGLSAHDAGGAAQHVGLGLFATLLSVLVHVVVFTYMTASGKMMTQAVLIGRLDQAPLLQIKRFKQIVSRCVGISFVALLAAGATGAMNPAQTDAAGSMPVIHVLSAVMAVLINGWAFHREFEQVGENGVMMTSVFEAYEAARRV